jgi:chemotaxis signal transduction protein
VRGDAVTDPGKREDASAATLRAAFDAAFARAASAPAEDAVALLALRVGGAGVAVRVLETAGLMAARPIVPVPSRRPELLGVSGVRGAVVPIYSLARLLGRADDAAPRWIVLAAAGAERVGLAVTTFDRHLVVPKAELCRAAQAGTTAAAHAVEVLHDAGEVRPVVSIPSLVRAITQARSEGG